MTNFHQTVIPAEPCTFTLYADPETGRLSMGSRVIAWVIIHYVDSDSDDPVSTISVPVPIFGDEGFSGYLLLPDGSVEFGTYRYRDLDEANEPGLCAERVCPA